MVLRLILRHIYSHAVFACAIAAPAGFEPDRRACFCGGGPQIAVLHRERLCWSARPLEKESANG